MNLVSLMPQNMIFCAALFTVYSLFAVALTITQRKIQQHRYQRRMNDYRQTGLNPDLIPESLRDLIPLARKWETASVDERRQRQRNATNAEKLELSQQIVGHEDTILAWLSLFDGQYLTREARSFESMLHSFRELQLVFDNRYLPNNEARQIDFAHQTVIPEWFPRAGRFRPRIVKNLPAWTSIVIGIPVFIVSFIIWGVVWSVLVPQGSSELGLVLVNFLSASTTGMTLILIDRLYELRQS